MCFGLAIMLFATTMHAQTTLFTEDFDSYTLGAVGPQSDNFTTWTLNPGGADDGDVTDALANSGTQSLIITDVDPDDVILLLGERTDGIYELTWQMYVPTGSSAYWNIQKVTSGFSSAGVNFNMQSFMEPTGMGDVQTNNANLATYNFPFDTWFEIKLLFALNADATSMTVNGTEVATWSASNTISAGPGATVIGSIDFFGNAGNLYYVDDIVFTEIEAPQYDVTFRVDMALIDDPDDIFIAGSFNDWSNEQMTLVSDKLYEITLPLGAGAYEYKFKNGPDGWEDISTDFGDCTAGGYGNRTLTVENENIELEEVCFAECADCQTVDVTEMTLANGIALFPNPAFDKVNINYEFAETVDLQVQLINSVGQIVWSAREQASLGSMPIDVSRLSAGLYFVKFSNGTSSITQKLIVQ